MFSLKDVNTGNAKLVFIYNQFFGVRIINYAASNEEESRMTDDLLDINLDLMSGRNKIFITQHNNGKKIYISVGGLAFNDIIYSSDFMSSDKM